VPGRGLPRTVHVEHCMGTVFTIDIRDAGTWDDAIAEVVAWLNHVDAVFSTYRADSEIERISRGELRVADADPDVATVLGLCADVQTVTGGYFSAVAARRLDPTGLVKGWAIERASELLRSRGSANHAVNGGGDLQLAGEARRGEPWRVGIADPGDPSRMVSVVAGRDCAIATSGTSERGHHIVDPFTGRAAAAALASATVTGPSLTYADAYATAAFVMGLDALAWIEAIDGYSALLVTADGSVHKSSGLPARPAPVGRPVSTSLDD
jgi:thiamine biosynthesis lipoprotein